MKLYRRALLPLSAIIMLIGAVSCSKPSDTAEELLDILATHSAIDDTTQGQTDGPSINRSDEQPSDGTDGKTTDDPTEDSSPTSLCGNGVIEGEEDCDDGNAIPGDGCSGVCKTEPGYNCPIAGAPCEKSGECGNGSLEFGEGCDDGNTDAADGCDELCNVEQGWACDATGCQQIEESICGDGLRSVGEQCDDGVIPPLADDGCDVDCQVEDGWRCPTPGEPCTKIETKICGNKIVDDGETCDDGNLVPGDGCSAGCLVETGYVCVETVCEVNCGDKLVVGDEACDDGNQIDGDGCKGDCSQVEDGYLCPIAGGIGGACIEKQEGSVCPNGVLEFGEFCDDGNAVENDGCTNCIVDAGYRCIAPNEPCELLPFCGDGYVDFAIGEQCDGGTGCTDSCLIQSGFICDPPIVEGDRLKGGNCRQIVCGDGIIEGNEQCDDNNKKNKDGCSRQCKLENGWTCPVNMDCQARECGDGIRAGSEQCDDNNKANGDGCSAQCELEDGYACEQNGGPCHETTCNDGIKEGLEPCDDGNNVIGDGCSPYCEVEPDCSQGACTSACGDGLMLPNDNEQCDDGNTQNGDGCSSSCRIETGFQCSKTEGELPDVIEVPITLRDFVSFPTGGSTRHPDFQGYCCGLVEGLVGEELSADRKPVYTGFCEAGSLQPGCPKAFTTSEDRFDEWYRDTPGVNMTKIMKLALNKQANGSYYFPPASFFPFDNDGFAAAGLENQSSNHNFGFTSEMRSWFEFKGDESLTFSGDDDVWIFINGKLVVDLGGVHGRSARTVTLNEATASSLDLEVGNVYEIALFHAERHTGASNFNLTLEGFTSATDECASVCGDGIKASNEQCDLGTNCANGSCNNGSYGGCTAQCKLANYCGDGQKNGPEHCDDGKNNSVYSPAPNSECATGCVFAPYCGDGIVALGIEQCDGGDDCKSDCTFEPRCGDGVTDPGEACDDGAQNGTPASECDVTCQNKCGNGTIDAGEQCDPGTEGFDPSYGGCLGPVGDQRGCVLGPHCGDGVRNGPEECDDGLNDGSYGTCAPGCTLSARCGDGTVQDLAGEFCDEGANNTSSEYVAGGEDLCTTTCAPVRFCGDGAVTDGEKCDDGVNDGSPGSCTPDCSSWIELESCGNGRIDTSEQCDEGTQNGTPESGCDNNCRFRCGNGIIDSGETCDDGVNSGNYGTCSPDCQMAQYCGDNIKNGPEQCDRGGDNEVAPYGEGKCDTSCQLAPYCGDGRLHEELEECDGQAGCTEQCKWMVPV